jgi:hypothetical protein
MRTPFQDHPTRKNETTQVYLGLLRFRELIQRIADTNFGEFLTESLPRSLNE